ncbi:BACON domain-containing protein [Parabacteroides sp.]
MKKWLGLILVLLLTSCVDEDLIDKPAISGEAVVAELNLWTPALSNSSLTKAMGEADEAAVNNLYVLVFDSEGRFLYGNEAQSITDTEDVNKKTAKVQLRTTSETVSVVALANMTQEGLSFSLPSANEDKTTFLRRLVYTVSSTWPAVSKGEDGFRPFPMWGELNGPVTASMEMNLLRALARVNLTIAAGQNFKMNGIEVYNSRTGGYCSPIGDVITSTGNVSVPSIPVSGAGISSAPLSYSVNDSEADTIRSYKNEIYVPEASVQDGFYLKVRGTIDGIAKSYKVEFKQNNRQLAVLRNHTYNVNVKRVGSGESDCDVTIEAWSDVTMKNPNSQYSLTVDKSSIAFVAAQGASESVKVTTDHEDGWKIDETVGNWFTAEIDGENLKITTTERNVGAKKEGSVSIRAGQLVKKIIVRQKEEATANCYIVSEVGTQQLFVNLKGNGSDGLTAEGLSGQFSATAELNPDKVAIIWETTEGLVTIEGNGIPNNGIISYTVNPVGEDKSFIGGNALIGAYQKSELIWSWHIWVVPDFDDGMEKHEEEWITGYTFLDRYLGATSSKPGIASLGLLYQWGRKDPFIGAGKIDGANKKGQPTEKAYTKMYNAPDGTLYEWKAGNGDLNFSIKNPTIILTNGLCQIDVNGHYLWGTDQGMTLNIGNSATNAGNKTIYDPCPIGYRVPPVDAFIFKTQNQNSYKINWGANNWYIPNNIGDRHGANGGGNGSAKYIENAEYYGFWIKYDSNNNEPVGMTSGGGYYQEPTDNSTWMPLGGVYDGDMSKFALVDRHNSLSVNSIVWTNSPIKIDNGNQIRPAAMFLHGTESSSGNGRHLHQLNETGSLAAKTQYAGSVRCVKDIKKNYSDLSSISPSTVTLAGTAGASQTVKLTSINEDWEVVDPGAKWFYVTPQEGKADGGSGQTLTLVAPDNNYDDVPSATLVIRLKDTGKELPVTVNRNKLSSKFVVNPTSLNFTAVGGAQNVSIESRGGWTITQLPDWISANMTSSSSDAAQTVTFTVAPNPSITSSRSYNVVVKQKSTDLTKTIVVKQAASVFEVSKSTLTFAAAGGSQTATIEATNGWTITESPNWLTASPTSNSDASRKIVTFTAVKNTTYDTKSGAVRVSNGSETKVINVTQSGRTSPSVSPNPLNVDNYNGIWSSLSGTISIKCESDVTWTATVNNSDNWVKISANSGQGNKKLTVTAGYHVLQGSRDGFITFKFSTGETVVLTVKQGY